MNEHKESLGLNPQMKVDGEVEGHPLGKGVQGETNRREVPISRDILTPAQLDSIKRDPRWGHCTALLRHIEALQAELNLRVKAHAEAHLKWSAATKAGIVVLSEHPLEVCNQRYLEEKSRAKALEQERDNLSADLHDCRLGRDRERFDVDTENAGLRNLLRQALAHLEDPSAFWGCGDAGPFFAEVEAVLLAAEPDAPEPKP